MLSMGERWIHSNRNRSNKSEVLYSLRLDREELTYKLLQRVVAQGEALMRAGGSVGANGKVGPCRCCRDSDIFD